MPQTWRTSYDLHFAGQNFLGVRHRACYNRQNSEKYLREVHMLRIVVMVVFIVCLGVADVCAQTTEFSYQGSIKDGVNPANGSYDIEFRLFTLSSGGSQAGPLLTRSGV